MVLSIQAHALATRMAHVGAKTAVIGVSGGLDSTLALLATVRAVDILKKDRKDVVAITMPGFGTTGKTYQNALKLMEYLGVTVREIPNGSGNTKQDPGDFFTSKQRLRTDTKEEDFIVWSANKLYDKEAVSSRKADISLNLHRTSMMKCALTCFFLNSSFTSRIYNTTDTRWL